MYRQESFSLLMNKINRFYFGMLPIFATILLGKTKIHRS